MATEAPSMNGFHHHPQQQQQQQQPAPYPADPYSNPHYAPTHPLPHPLPQAPAALAQSQVHPPPPTAPAANADSKNDIPKDEVGWFFVEQYYTTLSRNPEKLHLFYSRKSQFVSGVEAEKVNVVVGQKAINERIKGLGYHDCKVRVLNVDSQASFDNILVVVIGEISNKSEPPQKFVQTFVLAEQQNGYYVLNDIIRYLNDDDEEAVVHEDETTGPADNAEDGAEVEGRQVADSEDAVREVDAKLAQVAVNGVSNAENEEQEHVQHEEPSSNGTITATSNLSPKNSAPVPVIPASSDAVQPEIPKEPTHSVADVSETEPKESVATRETQESVVPVPASAPPAVAPSKAVPMSWASIASTRGAAGSSVGETVAPVAVATPAAPQPTAVTTSAVAAAPSQQPNHTPSAPGSVSDAGNATNNTGSEWQTASFDYNRRHPRGQSAAASAEDKILAYIKNVNEKVDASILRQTLDRFGKLVYFDVNRQRNCAFVEFADATGYRAAVAANPHRIGGEQVLVEERRPRANAYGGSANFNNARGGGGAGRGRNDRTGSQGGGRGGGFQKDSTGRYNNNNNGSRGRGGNTMSKGRKAPVQAA